MTKEPERDVRDDICFGPRCVRRSQWQITLLSRAVSILLARAKQRIPGCECSRDITIHSESGNAFEMSNLCTITRSSLPNLNTLNLHFEYIQSAGLLDLEIQTSLIPSSEGMMRAEWIHKTWHMKLWT